MIKRFYRSKFDIENLSRLRTAIPTDIDDFDYRGVVVNKPWGYEYLLYDNPHVAAWSLYLKYNHKTSMHCHPNKKTSLIVISGEVVCSTLEGWLTRKPGEGIIIDEGVFHSTRAVSKEGAFVIEVEAPPNKKDLVRLKDEYGREHQGYEGITKMSKNLDLYEYVDFHAYAMEKDMRKKLGTTDISLIYHSRSENIRSNLQHEQSDLLCLLKGKLHDGEGRLLLSPGDVITVAELHKTARLEAFSDMLYFIFSYGKKR